MSTQFLHSQHDQKNRLTIRFLESRAGTLTAELLRLALAGIGDEQGTVELDQSGFELDLGVLIDVLGVEGNLDEPQVSKFVGLVIVETLDMEFRFRGY